VVSRELARTRLVLLVPAAAELAAVAKIASDRDKSGITLVTALVLAPVAVLATAALAERLGGRQLAMGAAAVYVILPWLGRHYFYGNFLAVYDHKLMPALVGLEQTGWFTLGVGIAVLVAFAPERVTAAAGVLGAAVAVVAWVDGPWGHLWGNFHETTWSQTLLAFLPLAALVGAARRSPWLAAALGGWLAIVVLRGLDRDYGTGGFWLSVAGAGPAIAVLLSSLVYLVPRLRTAPAPDPVH
jgi:hypothetical protein